MLIILFLFIISFAIFTLIEIRDIKNCYFTAKRVISDFLLIALCSIFVGLGLGYIICVMVESFLPTKDVYVMSKDLYAVDDGNSISGRFYLMGGYIEDKPVIRYITDEQYGKQIKTVPSYQAYIIEGYSNPRLDIYESDFKEDWYKWIAFKPRQQSKYLFYVPENSILNKYEIDLEG